MNPVQQFFRDVSGIRESLFVIAAAVTRMSIDQPPPPRESAIPDGNLPIPEPDADGIVRIPVDYGD